jgi:RNA polymerase sigma-70 factor (ECF subfamily)
MFGTSRAYSNTVLDMPLVSGLCQRAMTIPAPRRRGHRGNEIRLMKWPLRPAPDRLKSPTDSATFEQVVLPHLDSANNLARWLVRDASLADDVVQEAVLRALNYFPSFRGGDARAWLMQIVRNAAYSTLAARRQTIETRHTGASSFAEDEVVLNIPDPSDDPEEALAHRERLDSLERALSALPVELRECLVLRELEELSYKEIAQVIGLPVGTVMSRLWRARQAILGARVEGGVA